MILRRRAQHRDDVEILRHPRTAPVVLVFVELLQCLAVAAALAPSPAVPDVLGHWQMAAGLTCAAWLLYRVVYVPHLELGDLEITVVNVVTTVVIPRGALWECRSTPGGGLEFHVRSGPKIESRAFIRGLLPSLRGQRSAVQRIQVRVSLWMDSLPRNAGGRDVARRWTAPSLLPLAACLVLDLGAAVLGRHLF